MNWLFREIYNSPQPMGNCSEGIPDNFLESGGRKRALRAAVEHSDAPAAMGFLS
jgi:hypothetical protein